MMTKTLWAAVVTVLAGAALAAQQAAAPKAAPKPSGDQARIQAAMKGAPADIAKNATIVEMDEKGGMKELRKGTNGWTCMPSATGVVGSAIKDPMCVDKTWMQWADAYLHKTDPTVKSVGVAYMLHGDQGASNTDPYATAKTADNQWVVSPPHIMILLPDAKALDTLPTDPHTGGAWVMWKGTKYAHIMVPISPVPH
jgi:hypothetical protein